LNIKQPGLQFYVNKIKQGQPFSFVRYGDGEWSAILADGRQRTGSGSHSLTIPQMQADMRKSVLHRHKAANYIMALRQTAMKPPIKKWVRQHAPGVAWHDCTVFYKASRKGRLYPFIQAVRHADLPVVVVGPPWMRRLNGKVFKLADFVDIPARNCYWHKDRIVKRVLSFGKPAIITVSAGPPGKIIVWELFKKIGAHSFIIDLGSLWDVYCGKRSRQYMRGMKPSTIRRNLHGE
jgi:hypothetical protein